MSQSYRGSCEGLWSAEEGDKTYTLWQGSSSFIISTFFGWTIHLERIIDEMSIDEMSNKKTKIEWQSSVGSISKNNFLFIDKTI